MQNQGNKITEIEGGLKARIQRKDASIEDRFRKTFDLTGDTVIKLNFIAKRYGLTGTATVTEIINLSYDALIEAESKNK